MPYEEQDRPALEAVLERFGEVSTGGHAGVAVRLARGVEGIADIVRALDAQGLRIRALNLHAPSLDDVFLAKTGRSLEEQAEEASRERRASMSQVSWPGQPIQQTPEPSRR
jgi:ABC-2 type transport system ATP-binding protein